MEIVALSTTAVTQAQTLPEPPRADSLAAERFNAVMNASDPAPTNATQAALESAFAPASIDTMPTLGGQILSGLRGVATDLSTKWQGLTAGVDNLAHQPTVTDVLRLQGQMLQISVQYEFVGKVVSRSTQNIDSLVRMS